MLNEAKSFQLPSEVEQQRRILKHNFQVYVINEIYTKYEELLKEQHEHLDALKKNLVQTPS